MAPRAINFSPLMESSRTSLEIEAFQAECVSLFVRVAEVLSIPRSVGEIYGLLFSTQEVLPMDEVIEKLKISKGSASQGLRWLRAVGAVRTTYVTGDRRDFFTAEIELRKLAFGFLREQIEPHITRGMDHLGRLDEAACHLPAGETRNFAAARVKKLRRWHRFASQMLPLFLRIAAKF